MRCSFTRIDPKTHRFRVDRAPHAGVDVVLETKSLLLHDLCHYAVEASLETDAGFYGCLAAGWELAALRDGTLSGAAYDRMMAIEGQVAMLQTAFRKARRAHADPAAWDILRRVWGAWSKARQGDVLVLRWPPAPPELEEGGR